MLKKKAAYPNLKAFDMTGYTELTGDILFKINGGKKKENKKESKKDSEKDTSVSSNTLQQAIGGVAGGAGAIAKNNNSESSKKDDTKTGNESSTVIHPSGIPTSALAAMKEHGVEPAPAVRDTNEKKKKENSLSTNSNTSSYNTVTSENTSYKSDIEYKSDNNSNYNHENVFGSFNNIIKTDNNACYINSVNKEQVNSPDKNDFSNNNTNAYYEKKNSEKKEFQKYSVQYKIVDGKSISDSKYNNPKKAEYNWNDEFLSGVNNYEGKGIDPIYVDLRDSEGQTVKQLTTEESDYYCSQMKNWDSQPEYKVISWPSSYCGANGMFGDVTNYCLFSADNKTQLTSCFVDTDNNGVIDYVKKEKIR